MAVLRAAEREIKWNLLLLKHTRFKEVKSEIVRLRPDAQRIVRQMQRESDLSASHIVSEIIKQAHPYVIFEEATDGES